MFLSIVMPVYNAEKYIEASIGSVLRQTCGDWELILVDDGSTDGSGEICDRYAREYDVVRVIHQANEGQLPSRQRGADEAVGEYVGFIDADDLVVPEYVSTLREYVRKNDVDIVCFRYREFSETGTKEYEYQVVREGLIYGVNEDMDEMYAAFVSGTLNCNMWSKIFKRILVQSHDDYSRFSGLRNGEDACQLLSIMSRARTIAMLNYVLYLYRYNEAGISKNMKDVSPDIFNMSAFFEFTRDILIQRGADASLMTVLEARNFGETVYRLLRFYRAADSAKRRKEIVDYDWSRYLMDGVEDNIADNPLISKANLKVWDDFKAKRYWRIYAVEKYNALRKVIGKWKNRG